MQGSSCSPTLGKSALNRRLITDADCGPMARSSETGPPFSGGWNDLASAPRAVVSAPLVARREPTDHGENPTPCDVSVIMSFLQEHLEKRRSPSTLKRCQKASSALPSHCPFMGPAHVFVCVFILLESTTIATTSVTPAETTTTAPTPTADTAESTTIATTSVTPAETTTTEPPQTADTAASTTTTPWSAPSIFYPFGAAAGDTEILENGGDTYRLVGFSAPFTYFGRKYNSIYINNNGLLTFVQPLPEAHPYAFPTHGAEDYIAALWTELDDLGIGRYTYQEYTNGSILTRATQDINQYFPGRGFTASWVFVATWDYVLTTDINVFNQHSAPAITVQAVLISGGGFSFLLMHYGDCAGEYFPVEAGYDTIGSTDYYVIHYNPYDGYYIPNLKTTSNVDVPGRWAFLVNNGTEIVIGLQMKLQSFLDLKQSGNMEVVLHQIKQELVNHGVSSNFELKLRKVKKT
ncbi:uncharacterized protein LOC113112139 [Carassius auratus]|uniref:Uncharacterized protein LOC113112139 n=1 Tax=Carassius auratus TaxID=7957 RepID=A0A6P6QII5_CARAU|nr:uncharacterized protein LOC113112139 [Carassius auratus]